MKTKQNIPFAWVLEALGLLLCAGLGIFFFWYRQCQLDVILLAVWDILLVGMVSALVWAERRTAKGRR